MPPFQVMCAGVVSNHDKQTQEVVLGISSTEYPHCPPCISEEIWNLILQCVQLHGKARPSTSELMLQLRVLLKRTTNGVSEAVRRMENQRKVTVLESRVENWRGYHLRHFGELLLDNILILRWSGVEREYHAFLFEKIILFCKESSPQSNQRKGRKHLVILKGQGNILPQPTS